MLRELRNNAKINNEILMLYGKNAKRQVHEINNNKFKPKINKAEFFTPSELKTIKYNTTEYGNSKKIPLPEIFNNSPSRNKCFPFSPKTTRKTISKFIKYNSLSSKKSRQEKDIKKKYFQSADSNFEENWDNYQYHKLLSEPVHIGNKIKNIQENFKKETKMIYRNKDVNKKNKDNIKDIKDKDNAIILNTANIEKKSTKDENFISNNKDFKSLTLPNKYVKSQKELLFKGQKCLIKMEKVENISIYKAKQFEKYFNVNDYGCGFSRQQYNFIHKKYFE